MQRTFIQTPKGLKAFLSHSPNNIAFHAGGDCKDSTFRDSILHNRQALITPFLMTQLAYLNQIHSTQIIHANHGGFLGDGDGIIITKSNIIGLIMVADCNPILLFDKRQKILILLHAGRAGVQYGILKKALQTLQKDFHTNLQDLFVYCGPSIRACCYEVKEEVFSDDSLNYGKILREGKIYLDLIAILKEQLESFGITHYEISPLCTCCENSYFSYRRDLHCGRFGLFAYLI